MCEYLSLFAISAKYLEALNENIAKAAECKDLNNYSVTKIQRVFRGYCIRQWIYGLNIRATEIQRCLRGHRGRKKVKRLKNERNSRRAYARFMYFAIQIQRSFKGYYSRKYKRNNAKRKQFIKDLNNKSEAVREMQRKYAEEQAKREFMERNQKMDDSCKNFAVNLHHLVSTKHMPGIYNPHPSFKETPTILDIPVEDHIRGVVKDLLRSQGIEKHGLDSDLHGSRKIPWKGLANRLSIQASAPYDAIDKEKLKMQHLQRIVTRGKGDFFAGGKTKVIDQKMVPISTGDPFCDRWKNPLLVRGVPENEEQLKKSLYLRKPLFVPHLERPFYNLSGGNKSSVLPNNLFDTMLEAETSGGSAQRHLGVTKRYGVPDDCDNRPATELLREDYQTLPAPPPRVSSKLKAKPRSKLYLPPQSDNNKSKLLENAPKYIAEDSSDEENV